MINLESMIPDSNGENHNLIDALASYLNELPLLPKGAIAASNGRDVIMHLMADDYPISLVREKNENGAIWGCILLYPGKNVPINED